MKKRTLRDSNIDSDSVLQTLIQVHTARAHAWLEISAVRLLPFGTLVVRIGVIDLGQKGRVLRAGIIEDVRVVVVLWYVNPFQRRF